MLSKVDVTDNSSDLPLPFTTSRCFSALRIWNCRRNPITIFSVVPFLRLSGVYMMLSRPASESDKFLTRVGNTKRLLIKPAFRFNSLFVDDLIRSVFIPVFRL
jgi:hypothetical protein